MRTYLYNFFARKAAPGIAAGLVMLVVFAVMVGGAPELRAQPVPGASPTAPGLQVQGLAIDQFLFEIDMEAGQTTAHTITLTNTTANPLTFTASINDFVVNGRAGLPLFLDSDQESNPKFSLSRWITITKQPQFTIQPGQQTSVEFSITVPEDAEPGTHYGGILFGTPLGQLSDSGATVQHKAGAIILVKLGKSLEEVRIDNFLARQKIYQRGPVEFLTSIYNYGTVHSKPKGDITIRNIWGRQVAQVPVNRDAQIVLPDSARDFTSVWNNKLGFGYYTAEAILYYGNPKLELRAETSFWMLPIGAIILGVLISAILCIILYIGIRRYNRYIIKRSL